LRGGRLPRAERKVLGAARDGGLQERVVKKKTPLVKA